MTTIGQKFRSYKNCTFRLFLELPACLLPMEHVVPVLRYSNRRSVHISRHIEWRYRMLSAIIFRFRIRSVLVWCTVTLYAVHHHILLFLPWLWWCTLIVILCVSVRHTKHLNWCIGSTAFRSLLMYSLLVWFPTNSVVFLSSDYVSYLTQHCDVSLSPHFRFSQRCGWRYQFSGIWRRLSTSRYTVTFSALPKNLSLSKQIRVGVRFDSLWI